MREVIFLAGRGGGGGSSLLASFANLAQGVIVVDADLWGAPLRFFLSAQPLRQEALPPRRIAHIDHRRCLGKARCQGSCRFGALRQGQVETALCLGCGACLQACPEGAISLRPSPGGMWLLSEMRGGFLLSTQEVTSSTQTCRLVSLLRRKARELARQQSANLLLVDLPFREEGLWEAELSGSDLAVIVLEPFQESIHELQALLAQLQRYQIPPVVVVNKADLHPPLSRHIAGFCQQQTPPIPLAGSIPFDRTFRKAASKGVSLVEYSSGAAALALRKAWERILLCLSLSP